MPDRIWRNPDLGAATATTSSSTAPRHFISNGLLADPSSSPAVTDPDAESPHKGISPIVVDRDGGVLRGDAKLDKIGRSLSDTRRNCSSTMWVPVENLLGEENRGFRTS